jgi:hypothetical protein
MNPLWGLFFKDRYKNPFSVYRMSFAELVFLLGLVGAIGYGSAMGIDYILDWESEQEVIEEK